MPRLLLSNLLSCLFLCLCVSHASAQDTTLVLDTSIFRPDKRIFLASTQGWVYHAGNNPAWASPDLNTKGWIKRKPSDLSAKDADKSGRVEGWFRIKIKLDSTFIDKPLSLKKRDWAAADLYVDGRLLTSFGNTGAHGKPFQEFYYAYVPPSLLALTLQREHVLAIHWVDYVSPFSPAKLKSDSRTRFSLALLSQQTTEQLLESYKNEFIYVTIWLTITLIMTVLFWLLPYQDHAERQIVRLLAIWGSLITLHNLFLFISVFEISYELDFITFYSAWFIFYLSVPISTIALFKILRRSLSSRLSSAIITISIIGGAWTVYTDDNRPGSAVNVLQSLVVLYLLISSWKNVRGAQWATVVGAVGSLLFYLLYAGIIFNIIPETDYNLMLAQTGSLISIPLSFIVYIILRFKEILAEVQQKAQAVVQVTEEKRTLLAAQNQLLEQQVRERTTELNQSLTELRSTQAQLIQKEKLASLGELTAGIAHEIQNPLNFVNNFSEVSTELVSELKQEENNPKPDAELIGELLDNLAQNLQKITHHGGRASAIVKGMLEHSRTETGEKRPTDLNALADEYLKIAYQGLRAKDKDFNAELKTNFETELGLTEVVPQDIGRVLLNLYNNAFYAVQQKQKTASADYQPRVMVSTTQVNSQVEIRIGDNGTGIAESVKAKVFQPFFTTKPTGEGTGLGLSLSHDIIAKGHQGSMQVSSQEGEGTEFIIELPQVKKSDGHS